MGPQEEDQVSILNLSVQAAVLLFSLRMQLSICSLLALFLGLTREMSDILVVVFQRYNSVFLTYSICKTNLWE